MSELNIRKIGVKFRPAAIIMTYREGAGSTRRRTIPVRDITKNSSIEELAAEMKSIKNHQKFISQLSQLQLVKMLTLIKDNLNGLSLDESLAKSKKLDTIDPNEDLNKADNETLARKKAAMEEMFVANQKKPTDPGFQYDIEVDFGTNDAVETLNWSDDDDAW